MNHEKIEYFVDYLLDAITRRMVLLALGFSLIAAGIYLLLYT